MEDVHILSSRLKGDIYWRKQKYYLYQAGLKSNSGTTYFTKDVAKNILKKYRELKKNSKNTGMRLSGNEFRDRPPTEVGNRLFLETAAMLMYYRDYPDAFSLGVPPDNREKLLSVINKMTEAFFKACGVDEKSAEAIPKDVRKKARQDFFRYREAYGALFNGEGSLPAPERLTHIMDKYEVIPVYSGNLKDYSSCIPYNYREQIRDGSLRACAVYEKPSDSNLPDFLYVVGRHNGWLEIVWMYSDKENFSAEKCADHILYCIQHEIRESREKLKGAFSELHSDETTGIAERIFGLAGMECNRKKSNIFEFSLADVQIEKLKGFEPDGYEVKSLCDCEKGELDELLMTMMDDSRVVPMPAYVDWDMYLSDISMVCFKNNVPVGVVLFTDVNDILVFELAYGADTKALPLMVLRTWDRACDKYGKGKKVLVPVVAKMSGDITEKLVEDAFRGDIIQGSMWF